MSRHVRKKAIGLHIQRLGKKYEACMIFGGRMPGLIPKKLHYEGKACATGSTPRRAVGEVFRALGKMSRKC